MNRLKDFHDAWNLGGISYLHELIQFSEILIQKTQDVGHVKMFKILVFWFFFATFELTHSTNSF